MIKKGDIVAWDVTFDANVGTVIATRGFLWKKKFVIKSYAYTGNVLEAKVSIVEANRCIKLTKEDLKRLNEIRAERKETRYE